MQEIPLQAVPSQMVKTVLAGQNVQLLIYQKSQGLFVDVNFDDIEAVSSVIARDAVPIVCRQYTGFVGNLLFIDTQGNADPEYTGLGNRFSLVYLTEAEFDLLQ